MPAIAKRPYSHYNGSRSTSQVSKIFLTAPAHRLADCYQPRKIKISHDPNNTTWARSTNGFGHKILTSHGWTPGSFLGAHNAAHADTFTVASASHIKVTLKDDTLGLGARPRGLADGEPTGLDAFQGLLGRLNGKNDSQLEEEQRKRDDVKLAIYAQRKWQGLSFISGGFLVQDKEQTAKRTKDAPDVQKGKRLEENDDSDDEIVTSRRDNQLTAKPPSSELKINEDTPPKSPKTTSIKKRKEKSKKRKKLLSGASGQVSDDGDSRKSFNSKSSTSGEMPSSQRVTKSKEQRPIGRHVIRGRHIRQKKQALMDDRSLNEVLSTP